MRRLIRGREGARGAMVRYVVSSQHSSLFFVSSAKLRTVRLYGQRIKYEASVIQVLYQDYTRDKIFNNCIIFLSVC